MATTISK